MNFDHDLGKISSLLVIDTTVAPPTPGGEVGTFTIEGTGALALPFGTTGQQPTVSTVSMIRYNTSLNRIEFHNGTIWSTLLTTTGDLTSLLDSTYVNVSGDTMTGTLTLNADPTSALHAATKQYVDAVASGLDPKGSVRVATTEDIFNYSPAPIYNPTGGTAGTGAFTGAPPVLDTSVTLSVGDRILVKDQTDQKQNGIYYVQSSGVWYRATDQDGTPANEVSSGNYTFVEQGTVNSSSGWVLTGNGILTLNTNNLIWTKFSESSNYTWGIGLSSSGSTVNLDLSSGQLTAIGTTVESADRLAIFDNGASVTGGVTIGTLLTDVNLNTSSNAVFGSVQVSTLKLDDTDSTFFLNVQSTSTLTADKTLTVDVDDANRTLRLGTNLTVLGDALVVNTSTAATDSILTYNGSQWVDGTVNLASTSAVTGTLAIANGGTSATTATAAFNNLAPTTTKGDLIVHNGTDNIRVAVGTNTYALVADSATASGVNWAAVQSPLQLYKENPVSPTALVTTGNNSSAQGSGASATSVGGYANGDGTDARIWGQKAYANGKFATAGDAQSGLYVLRNLTTDGVATELFLDGVAATQRIVLPNNSAFTFEILITARRTDAVGGAAGYKFEGVISKDASAASTAFIGNPVKSVLGETNSQWNVDITVDTTNGSLKVSVTGQAAKTIRWVAVVKTSEVTN